MCCPNQPVLGVGVLAETCAAIGVVFNLGKSVHDSARYTRGAYGLMVRLTCQDGAGAGQPGVYRVRAHAAASVYEIFEICEPR